MFVHEYLRDFNATQAAIRSGYSEKTAYSIGWENLKKPDVAEYLKKQIEEKIISSDETKKILSDIARGSLNDYMVIRKVERVPKITRTLKQLVKELEEEIETEEAVINVAIADRRQRLKDKQSERKENLVRLQARLRKEPKAVIVIDGEPELVEVAELDLVKLAQDFERGRIKSFKYGQFGPQVELYAADAALANLARIHGLFEKDNAQKPGAVIVFEIPNNGRG